MGCDDQTETCGGPALQHTDRYSPRPLCRRWHHTAQRTAAAKSISLLPSMSPSVSPISLRTIAGCGRVGQSVFCKSPKTHCSGVAAPLSILMRSQSHRNPSKKPSGASFNRPYQNASGSFRVGNAKDFTQFQHWSDRVATHQWTCAIPRGRSVRRRSTGRAPLAGTNSA
jgi:hypothetical protein